MVQYTDPQNSELTYLQVVGMNWIEIPAGKYKLVSKEAKKSTCQIELRVA